MQQFHKFILDMKIYVFRTVPLSTIRSLFTVNQQWYMSYRYVDSFRAGPGWKSILVLLLTCRVSCPKQICEISATSWFYYKEICYDARSHERKIYKGIL